MQKELKSLWDTCVTFHGHGCGGLAVGFRAVLYAWELFGSGRAAEDEEIVCVAETDACGVDAIQALMSCTVGKGNLIFNLQGKNAFSFYRRSDGTIPHRCESPKRRSASCFRLPNSLLPADNPPVRNRFCSSRGRYNPCVSE